MSYSAAQEMAVFEILDVPYATSYNTLTGIGGLSANTSFAAAGASAAKTAILASMAAITGDYETALKVHLDRWITLGTSKVRIVDGGADDLPGVRNDPDEEKAEIRKKVVGAYLPYFRWHEVMAKELGGANSNIIPVTR